MLWWTLVVLNWLNVVSEVPHGPLLLLFLLYTSELFTILENKLIGYADDPTLMGVVPSPGVRVTMAECQSRDIAKVSEWCDLCGMQLNASKSKTMIVSRSRTMHPQSPALTIGGTVLKESNDLVILGMTFDSKMTFDKHLRSVSRAASQKAGLHCILRKSWQVFYDRLVVGRCFRGLVLPGREYCSAVWCSAADTHMKLLYRVVSCASFLTGCMFSVALLIVDLWRYYVCCTSSGVTRCSLFIALYLSRMCRCVLQAVL